MACILHLLLDCGFTTFVNPMIFSCTAFTLVVHLQGSAGLNVEQRMFDVLVERKHPRLMEVFDRLECSLSGLTGEWFSRMFTTALPAETTARVWDCVMVEGPKVLFRAALSLIKVSVMLLPFTHAMIMFSVCFVCVVMLDSLQLALLLVSMRPGMLSLPWLCLACCKRTQRLLFVC